jgi:hypothetical protein
VFLEPRRFKKAHTDMIQAHHHLMNPELRKRPIWRAFFEARRQLEGVRLMQCGNSCIQTWRRVMT